MPVYTEIANSVGVAIFNQHVSGDYYQTPATAVNPGASAQGDMRLCPFWIPQAGGYDRIVTEVTTIGEAGSLLRLGIYAADPNTGIPVAQAPLVDAGTVPGDTSGTKEIVITASLPAGLVWLTSVAQNCPTTAPTVRLVTVSAGLYPAVFTALASLASSGGAWQKTGATGALPAWSSVGSSGATVAPKLWLRKA